MDEPSANLDIAAMEKLSERMKVIKEKGHTVIVAEHRLAWNPEIRRQNYLYKRRTYRTRIYVR